MSQGTIIIFVHTNRPENTYHMTTSISPTHTLTQQRSGNLVLFTVASNKGT